MGSSLTQLDPYSVQDCGRLPDTDWRKDLKVLEKYVTYQHLYSVATGCGLPSDSVRVTAPAKEDLANKAHEFCNKAHEQYTALKT